MPWVPLGGMRRKSGTCLSRQQHKGRRRAKGKRKGRFRCKVQGPGGMCGWWVKVFLLKDSVVNDYVVVCKGGTLFPYDGQTTVLQW